MPRFALFQRAALVSLSVLFALFCLAKARLIGDGMEYLAMAQGFVAHGSPELHRSDVADFAAMPPGALARARLHPPMLLEAIDRIEREGAIVHGFARAQDGSVRAIHFWMYSLLAAPFYLVVTLLGQNPFMALAALNLAIVAASAWRTRAWLPGSGLPELGLLVLMGPVFYGAWSGPEVMAGCCVLLSVLAALRRDPALAVALAGLGATQNPSIAGLIPAAGAYVLLLRCSPASALFPAPAARPLRGLLLVAAGVVATVLPWLENQRLFGMPSIIGRYYTDIGLVRPERLFSFLFDLNQGLVVSFPALLSCAAIVLLRATRPARRTWLLHLALALLLVLGLALPTLAATNWSSGAIVVARYAYWTSMPLLAVCLAGLARLDARSRWTALGLALLLQALAAWSAMPGRRAPTLHARLPAWVLDHAPRAYNPDPEIFLERERKREDFVTHDQVVVHRNAQGPNKLMRFWANGADSGGVCAPGTHLAAEHVVTLASGWRYYNGSARAPLRCEPGQPPVLDVAVAPAILGDGWSVIQGSSVWNEGRQASLRIALPAGRRAVRIGLVGYYNYGVRRSRVRINGIELGTVALGQAPLELPPALANVQALELVFEHTVAPQPASATDTRALGFMLHGVRLELAR